MNQRLPLTTWLYFSAQAINLTAAIMSVTMAAVVGTLIASRPALATLPYGFQFVAVMLVTYPAARLMDRIGRRNGFLFGNLFLGLAGLLGFISIQRQCFALLIVTHIALGIYIGFANFNRFAAADRLAPHLKSRAISLVVAGGVLAAFLGPFISGQLRAISGYQEFALGYAALGLLAVLASLIALLLPAAKRAAPTAQPSVDGAGLGRLLRQKSVIVAIAGAALGYGVMNLLMVEAELHMTRMQQSFAQLGSAVQWHVVAMFAPAFFTAQLLRRLDSRRLLYAGMLLLILACGINLTGPGYGLTAVGLIVLGLGWSFTYVGGAALLTATLGNHPQALKIQGINDVGIAIMATLGAFLPAPLMSGIGWHNSNLVLLLLCALALLSGLAAVNGRAVSPANAS